MRHMQMGRMGTRTEGRRPEKQGRTRCKVPPVPLPVVPSCSRGVTDLNDRYAIWATDGTHCKLWEASK